MTFLGGNYGQDDWYNLLDILQTINLIFRVAAGEHYFNEFMGMVNDFRLLDSELARLLAQTEVFQQR